MGKILGIDFGTVRIGLALSDISHILATPYKYIPNDNKAISEIAGICKDMSVELIVIGYPYHMNGDEGESCAKVNDFAGHICKSTGLNIIKWDERLSSSAVHTMIISSGKKRSHEKGRIDKMAAAYILQGYLDSKN